MIQNGYWAFAGYENELAAELKSWDSAIFQQGRLFLSTKSLMKPLWAQLVLPGCLTFEFESVSQASKQLLATGKRWASTHEVFHRRAELIQQQVFKYKNNPLKFLGQFPERDWGFWTMLTENKLVACAKTGHAFPSGEIQFVEDKENAPSRAYLKLWETFTVQTKRPGVGATVLDLGSSPGGWTWVLQQLGCKVISVDKAELDPRLMADKKIQFIRKDAFKLKPADVGPIDWLFSDLICYPAKLYELVQEWRASGLVKNFVCTIKFQGDTDYESLKLFSAIAGSRLVHLCHNKHEVTWILTQDNDL